MTMSLDKGPALCHDALYSGELLTRDQADWMFLQFMQIAGIAWIKRNIVWSAVRSFGWTVWNRHTWASVLKSRELCKLVIVSGKGSL